MYREGRNYRGRKFWQWAKHAWLYSDLLQPFKGEAFHSSECVYMLVRECVCVYVCVCACGVCVYV